MLLDPGRPLRFSSLADGKEGLDERTHVGGLVETPTVHTYSLERVMLSAAHSARAQKSLLVLTFLFLYSSVMGLSCGMCDLVP